MLSAVAIASLSGCSLGPDYKRPALPESAGYSEKALPQHLKATDNGAGDAQNLVSGRDIPGDWWKVFGSTALSNLIASAIETNPDVEAAKAAMRQAQENARAGRSAWFPSATAKTSVDRIGFSADALGLNYSDVFTLNTGQVNISYPLDFSIMRRLEVVDAQSQYQRFQLEAAYVTLSSNAVVTAIQEASLRAQIDATQSLIATKRRILQLLERQFALGGAAVADVLAQKSSVTQSETNLPQLRSSLEQQRTLLRTLAGKFPSEPLAEQFSFSDLRLPDELPVSLPSSLVEQRPDIRSAEAQLRAASAQVGIAISNMLPQISLSSAYGRISLTNIAFPFWDLGVSLSLPVFDGGKRLHERRAADAGLEAAAARYRSTVLNAFRNVADTLQALESDAESVAAQRSVERVAAASFAVAEKQYRAGSSSFLTLLNAQSSMEQAKIGLIQAEARRLTNTAALYQALGGGWWNRPGAAPTGAGKPAAGARQGAKS